MALSRDMALSKQSFPPHWMLRPLTFKLQAGNGLPAVFVRFVFPTSAAVNLLSSQLLTHAVRGEIVPPNQVFYRDAFDGLKADVIYIWSHGSFAQEVVLLERALGASRVARRVPS
jgi:hypothetical protein